MCTSIYDRFALLLKISVRFCLRYVSAFAQDRCALLQKIGVRFRDVPDTTLPDTGY